MSRFRMTRPDLAIGINKVKEKVTDCFYSESHDFKLFLELLYRIFDCYKYSFFRML